MKNINECPSRMPRPLWWRWLRVEDHRLPACLALESYMPKDGRGWAGLVQDMEDAAAALHARALYIRSARRGSFVDKEA
jgi:hypothetical protein